MVGQISSINSIESGIFKLVEFGKSGKPLPSLNSIVSIKLLDKMNDGFKILIGGRVYFSKLPVDLKSGETIIAKVINHQPFTLSLDNLINLKNYEQISSLILSRLQLENSETSKRIIKAHLSEKKPLIKSRLEKLINNLNQENDALSEDQIGFFVNVMNSPDHDNISPGVLKLLKGSPAEISEEIFNVVKEIISSDKNLKLTAALNDAFVLDLNDAAALNAISVKEKSNQVLKFFEFIENHENINDISEYVLVQVNLLKEKLAAYNLIKAYYLNMGILISFIIIKTGDHYEKLEYHVEAFVKKNSENHSININMNPENLGEICINGMYNEQSIFLKFKSEKHILSRLVSQKKELVDKIDELKIPLRIDFEERRSDTEEKKTG